jgi:hypothetical protein
MHCFSSVGVVLGTNAHRYQRYRLFSVQAYYEQCRYEFMFASFYVGMFSFLFDEYLEGVNVY